MTPAKLWLQIFLVGFTFIVGLLVVTLATPAPYGDLTRIGQLSDHEFGWRVDQPHVEPQYLHASPVNEADVLVVGDSFSMTFRWQSVLTKAGYRVSTIYWGQFGLLCEDFDDWINRAGFKGKLIVIESVERLLGERLASSQKCTKMLKPIDARLDPFFKPAEQVPGLSLNWNGKLTSGYVTYKNTSNAKKATGDMVSAKVTWVRPVADGCSMFSHRSCDKGLFFYEDVDNGELTSENVAQMQAFTAAHTTHPILWMVIPNKTTVYVEPDHSKDFVTAFRQSGLGPDLFGYAQQQKTKVRDFYYPNDSHLSMHGQLAVGQVMLEAIRKVLPPPPGKAS